MIKKEEIDTILLRYLLGESNQEEQQEVCIWIEESPENRLYFEEIRKLHHRMQGLVLSESVQGDYTAFRLKMQRHLRWRRLSGVAACIALLIGIGSGIYLYHDTGKTENAIAETTTILPGKSRAILHLSSGTSVNLQADNQQLQEKDGTRIQVSEDGSMNYQVSPEVAASGEIINRLEIPRGGEFKLTLSDGTEVWLNSETELQYPTTFTTKERIVKLKGEAYFKVTKNTHSPFIVMVDNVQVKVYGTQFNITTQNKGKIETVLVNGSIGITYQGQETILTPSQKAEFSEGIGKIAVENVNVLPYIAWKEGNFMFHNESLESIMEKLSRWYDIQVFYTNENIKNVRLSGILERYKDVNELFHHFEKISPAEFIVKGNTVTIR